MGSNYKMLKNWYRLAKPNKFYLFFQFMTVFLRYVCWLIAAIFTAKATTCLSVQDYPGAFLNLSLNIGVVILSAIIFAINYYSMRRLIAPIYNNIQYRIIDKVINSSNKNFKKMSKEKIINIIGNDVYAVAEFADTLSGRIARLARVLITIITIFVINPLIGVLTLIVNVANYFILNAIYEKKSIIIKKMKESNDHVFQEFSEIVDSKEIINNNINMKNKIIDRYIMSSDNYTKIKQTNMNHQSTIDNTFYAYYKITVYLISMILIFLMTKNAFDLTTYLILVPYVLSSIEIANEAFQLLPKIKETNISCNRIKAVLNFTEAKKLATGENEEDFINGVISFNNVTYKSSNKQVPSLKLCNFHIRENQITVISGIPNSGKRTIFKLLSRQIKPTNGLITLSGINIYDFSKETYQTNFNFITTKPFIFKGTILKNLKLVENSNKKIVDMCKMLNLHEHILELPKKYHTNIDKLTSMQKYLLAIAQVLLTRSEVIALYEFPNQLSFEDKEAIFNTLKNIKGNRTIIIFSAMEESLTIADKIIKIENGEIVNIYFNDSNKLE